ncbi:MAG: putative secreted protein [Candidatus Phytoplasma cynodontis]|nr:MAG: putative secreted protein [Candidatus Phytoplasma cynodontis]
MNFNTKKKNKFNLIFLFITILFLILTNNYKFDSVFAGLFHSIQDKDIVLKNVPSEIKNKIKPFQKKIDYLLKEKDLIVKEFTRIEESIFALKSEIKEIKTGSGKTFKFKNSNDLKIFYLQQKKDFFIKRKDEISSEIKMIENLIKDILESSF